MAESVVERMVVAIRYVTDSASYKAATNAYQSVSMGIAGAAAAAAGFAVAQAAALDRTAKTARALGQTTEEYTALAYAADRSGVAEQDLGAASRALQMQLGAAAAGSAEVQAMFNKMDVSFRDATGNARSAAEVLPELADGLRRLPSDGARATTQLRLLSEGGAKLTSFFAGGSAEIRKLQDRASALGIVLSTKTGAAAERLTDSMTDVRAVFRGVGLQLADVLMPAVADGADAFVDMAIASDGFIRLGTAKAVRLIGLALEFIKTPAGKATSAVVGFGAALGAAKATGGLLDTVQKSVPALSGLVGGIKSVGPAALKVGVPLALLYLALDDIYVTAQGGDSMIRRLADAMGVGQETADAFAATGDLVASAWGAAGGVLQGVGIAASIAGSSFRGAFDDIAEWAPLLKLYVYLFDELMARLPTLSGFITGIGDSMKGAAEGWRLLGRFAMGDKSVQLNTSRMTSDELAGPIAPIAALPAMGMARVASLARADNMGTDRRAAWDAVGDANRMRLGVQAQPAAPAAPVTMEFNLGGFQAGSMSAREVGAQAGRETQRQVTAALSAVYAGG